MISSCLIKELEKSATASQWKRIGVRHHHGILVPLASLHTKNSCGIGEFLDLIPLIDWCHEVGFDVIQLLPLNNAPTDASPYLAESSCALNPIYLSLCALEEIDHLPALKSQLPTLQALTQHPSVEHYKVAEHKLCFLKEYFTLVGKKRTQERGFIQFVESQPWLKPYALFKTLKHQFHFAPWSSWPDSFQHLSLQKMEALYPLHEEEIAFHCFLQYLCYLQLLQVKQQAAHKQCFLMGDLPILLGKESADNWQWVEFFDPFLSAGAPPDQYNAEGQNWNLPLFNWDALKKADFQMLKQRLKYAQTFYDLFRIDHILGFFRLFAIPFYHPSKDGHYIPSDDASALKQGQTILQMVTSSTTMLPIGEDLGSVPDYVRPCLRQRGICGTRVMRWEREWKTTKAYIPPSSYDPLSLCCISTHDSEPLTLFWQSCQEEAQAICQYKGWSYQPTLLGNQREALLRDCHHSSSLFHINPLQEYLAFFKELVHADPRQERMNTPGQELTSNWTYRYLPSVEQIGEHVPLKEIVRKILKP